MKRIAICGNIASGKSTVQNIVKEKGYKVIDADEVSHYLLTVKNAELFEGFKNYDVFEDGEFSRYKVAKLIFSNEEARLKIASIMHPQVGKEIEKFFLKNQDEKLLFVGIPLLFEANLQNLFDVILFIYTDDEIRLERLLKRNNYPLEHAKSRIKSQMAQDEKVKMSDFVINNNGTYEDLIKNVYKFLEQIS